MNPNPPDKRDGDGDAFLTSLQLLSLRSPLPEWREEILTASRTSAPVPGRWHRSPFWRSMAALWAVLLFLMVDTLRITPAPSAISAGFPPVTSPAPQPDLQSLLAGLNHSNPPRLP